MCTDNLTFFEQALHSMKGDMAFSLPTPSAQSALHTANKLLEWIHNHQLDLDQFQSELIQSLSSCFPERSYSKQSKTRTLLWSKYHLLRTSDMYINKWKSFVLKCIEVIPSPVFYQYVGHFIFKNLVKERFVPRKNVLEPSGHDIITSEEMNAIRYAAGYVPRAVKKRLSRTSKPNKEDLICCLSDLICDAGEDPNLYSDWLCSIDRGGLVYVNDMAFELFVTMERELRTHLHYQPKCLNDEAVLQIKQSEDILFLWSIIMVDWNEDISNTVLDLIVNMWITIRGFAQANAWMELYKKAQKKSTQKTKGLRKQLIAHEKNK